jgi:DHA2 family methylenomycin A resistance protein-like MFS transporter
MSTTSSLRADTRKPAQRPSGWVLVGLSLGYFMVLLDTTIVTVALPAIGASFTGGLSALQWVVNGYTTTFAALLLTGGWLADRYGGRRIFLVGLAAFGLFSAVSAAAVSLAMLVVLRLLLGVAGALLLPTSLAIIANAYTDPVARARAVGNWAAITGFALVCGPVLGGLLVDTVGWRAIFLINVPLAALSFGITARLAPETARKPRSELDIVGQLTAIVSLSALVYGLVEGPALGWHSVPVVGAFAVALLAGLVFGVTEARSGDAAMLPLHLFRSRRFSSALIGGLLANFGLAGVLFVLSLFFQESRRYSPLETGLIFLPLTLPTAFNPIFTGRLVGRIGPRRPATLGFALMGAGTLLQAPFTGNSPAAVGASIVGLLCFGFGMSFALPSLVASVAGSVPVQLAGIGAGALNSFRQVGASLGVAVLGVVLAQFASSAHGTQWALLVSGVILLIGALVIAVGLRQEPTA